MSQVKKSFLLFIIGLFSIFYFSFFSVIFFKSFNPFVTGLMVFKSYKNHKINKKWILLEDVSKKLLKSIIKAEDQRFYIHKGFDFNEIKAALVYNRQNNNKRGASTISQQVSKNVFLFSSRSWFRKILEAYYTVLIEVYWGKDRILEVYLNIAETGRGLYGVESASQFFYNKNNLKLTLYQTASIVASLPNPEIYSPLKYNEYLNQRRWRIINEINK